MRTCRAAIFFGLAVVPSADEALGVWTEDGLAALELGTFEGGTLEGGTLEEVGAASVVAPFACSGAAGATGVPGSAGGAVSDWAGGAIGLGGGPPPPAGMGEVDEPRTHGNQH